MPDKSKCQHLFLCCQFFMVFDDISPIVRPTYAASCPLSVARCWPLLGPCVPIWLNRTCTVDAGSGNSCWLGHRSVLFANAWALLFGFLSQELWLSPPPDHCFNDETFRAMRGIRSRCKTAATGSISVANVSSSTSQFPPLNWPARPENRSTQSKDQCNRIRHVARFFVTRPS